MYIYFDSNGTLKEIITERPFRVGDVKRNKIYVYWDGEHAPASGWVKYRKPDGTDTTETSFFAYGQNLVEKELPQTPVRNLKYFSYDHTYVKNGETKVGYQFYEITVPNEVLNSSSDNTDLIPTENNMVVARIRFVMVDSGTIGEIDDSDTIETLGAIVFSVETNMGIITDSSIDETQYNYLLWAIGNKVDTSALITALNNKTDRNNPNQTIVADRIVTDNITDNEDSTYGLNIVENTTSGSEQFRFEYMSELKIELDAGLQEMRLSNVFENTGIEIGSNIKLDAPHIYNGSNQELATQNYVNNLLPDILKAYDYDQYPNLNDAPRNSVISYTSTTNIENQPNNQQGTLLTFGASDTTKTQIYITHDNDMYVRRLWGFTWTSWEKTATQNALDLKVDKSSIVDNTTTNDATKVLSAKQGKVLRDDLRTETTNRQNADNNLQSQIDGINAGQNLADIVADLTALGNLDTTKLQSGDKVEVLSDSNHDNVSTVYNWNGTAFVYIGAYGMDSYTKAQMDTYLAAKQDKIDSSHKLSSDLVDDTGHTNKFVTQSQKVKIDNAYGPSYVGKDTSTNILAKGSNTGIWVGTDNNHWYYWNGSAYVDGGIYQATQIEDGSINWNKLTDSVLASQLEEISYDNKDTERFINSDGNQGDIGSNDLYYLATETNIMYVIETGVSLGIPLVYFNGTAYNGTDNIVTIVGNNTVAFINNNSSVKTLKIWKTKISNNSNIINNNIIQKDITANIEIYETNRYINNAGVEGGFTGYNIYALDTKPNCKYIVKTVGNSGSTIIPHIYYNNVSYPDTRVVYFNDFGIYLITGTGLRAYINNYDSSYFSVIELSQFDLNYKLETMYTNLFKDTDYSYTENRYINSSGIQGNLTNLNLYKFYAKKGTIYHIKTYSAKVNELPFLYSNAPIPSTRPYGDYYETYYVGNNNIVYVNGNSTLGNTVIQEFNPTNETFNIMGMFRNITCCGDSLTYSQVYTSSTTSRQALVTYPQVLGKLSGANVTQYASGGYNTEDWWNAYNENITSDNLYIIFLGTNNGLTNTVDTDCAGDDYTTYANTYTGYYGRIIRKILDNGSKCILIKCGVTSGSLQDTNNAIENLGIKFDIPVLENFISLLDDEYYHLSPTDSSYINTVHLNDLGYAKFANYVFKAINNLSAEELYKLIV